MYWRMWQWICVAVCGVSVDSCRLCVLFGCQKRPPSFSFIIGIESFFGSHGRLLHLMFALAMVMSCGGAGVAGKTGSGSL